MVRLGGAVGSMPACRTTDLGSNPGSGANYSESTIICENETKCFILKNMCFCDYVNDLMTKLGIQHNLSN